MAKMVAVSIWGLMIFRMFFNFVLVSISMVMVGVKSVKKATFTFDGVIFFSVLYFFFSRMIKGLLLFK